ncbi:hypothetical protein UT300003_14210 [Clostridium sardiniense]|uniref:helix-hairpin-helix domain-containing protein n=1 Tax=Clostridium sardiniense TaxID=29369 RepID=UPI0019587FF1|nr:helix-hairpin-helix domain-containing protein [Clostridium sardiniense]MBM7836154.1 competence protein ComEA [Clostridium sardiniense]
MDSKKKSIGLIAILIILGSGFFINYLFSGRRELNKNNNDSIFVEEDINEEESESKSSKEKISSGNESKGENKESGEAIKLKDNKIAVDIKGEVRNQGVYYLDEGSIVEDLIKEAGGLTEKASLDLVNRAEKLTNNKCVVIPSKEESAEIKETKNDSKEKSIPTVSGNGSLNSSNDSNGIININTADESDLVKINGIGPSKAKAIISYREENGNFKSIEDIKNVSGIGEGTFLKIKDSISV